MYDILELNPAESNETIFNKILLSSSDYQSSHRVKEFFIILLNALASEYLGRCYLLQRKDIVPSLIQILFMEGNMDTSLR